MRHAALLLAMLLAAGCAELRGGAPRGADEPEALAALRFGAPVPVSTEYPGAEPVIAVAPDGTIYVEGIGSDGTGNVNKISRSDDGGATWIDITPPAVGESTSNDGFVAVSTDGTLYGANVFGTTFQLFRSEDKGASWEPLAPPRVPASMHRHWIVAIGDTVHLAQEAFPPGFAGYLVGLPTLAEAGTPNEGMWYVRSEDGGTTWSIPQQIDPIVNFAGQGNMAVSADGTKLYIPRYEEERPVEEYTYADGRWYMLASEDGGASWERREMFDLTSEISTAVPALAVDPAGALLLAWSQEIGGQSRVVYASSPDTRAWSAPRELTDAPGTHAMAWLAARAQGEIGVMWYSANATGTASKVAAEWFVDYALVQDATSGSPRVTTARVTPAPVHHGNICAKGPACGAGEDRSLLDYPWMVFHDERAHLVFPSTEWERGSAYAVVAIEQAPAAP